MADLDLTGTKEANPTHEDKDAKHTKTRTEVKTEEKDVTIQKETQVVFGNVPIVVIKFLEAINKNLVALTEEVKKLHGRPRQ